jgi:4-amino-4-deoxy-L-arabinose transferase-like glycosyltransferase
MKNRILVFLKKTRIDKFELGLLLLTAFSWLLVWPIGEFPLNDDFAYNLDLQQLLYNNPPKFVNWPAMTLIGHLLWAFPFAKIFGFSFLITRFSVLILGTISVIVFYRILSYLRIEKSTAFVLTLFLLFNPLFFSLMHTFMTDVSFFFCFLLAVYTAIKFFQTNSYRFLWIAILFILLSITIRQHGVVLLVALSGYVLLTFEKHKYRTLFVVLFGLIAGFALVKVIGYWMHEFQPQVTYFAKMSDLENQIFKPLSLLENYHFRAGKSLFLFGLFLFPIALLSFMHLIKSVLCKNLVIIVIISLVFLVSILRVWGSMPGGSILSDIGLGSKTFLGDFLKINAAPSLPVWGLVFFKIISVVGAWLIVLDILMVSFQYKHLKQLGDKYSVIRKTKLFVFLLLIVYMGLLFSSVYYFDRYIIPVIPLVILLIVPFNYKPSVKAKTILLMVAGFWFMFSTFATHDYFAWNRARWNALNHLSGELNVSSLDIDGGFEFNGWYNIDKVQQGDYDCKTKGWYWVDNNDYTISFVPLPGFVEFKTYPYFSFLGMKEREVYILKKK